MSQRLEARNLVRRICLLALALTLTLVAASPPAHAAELTDAAAQRMIADLGLIESPTPIRASPGWRKPQRVLVWRASPEVRAALQEVAPGIEIVTADTAADYASAAATADVVLGPCQPAMVSAARNARWLQSFSAGVENCVSQGPIREGRMLLTNMQRIGAPVMADHVMALLLAFSRNLPWYLEAQRQSKWAGQGDGGGEFGLSGKTMFIAGLGGTGLEIAKRANGFGMRVTGTRNSRRDAPDYVSYVGLPDELPRLVAEADVVVNALPLTAETRGLFNAKTFAAMKKGARFFNVGRGATVVTSDLVDALRSGRLAAAGLDVMDPEPLPGDHPLWKMPNVIITPHMAADAEEFGHVRWLLARENLRRYVKGERLLSVVDPGRGY
jgi:phosphoglycerate dehydrogenase-like enzyme